MSFSDERDYDEETYNKAEMEREGREELEYERLENLGLIPEEHNHGFTVWADGSRHRLECIDCHDFEQCDDFNCLWCFPG